MKLKLITRENFVSSLCAEKRHWQDNYLAMYSTRFGGYVTDPDLMLVPADDHLVHRGDGVFDVMRCINGKIYQMEAHLKRLESSAMAISLEPPAVYNDIRDILKTLVLKGGEKECVIRIILSRGPGGFSTNPFECPSSQMYINVIRYHKLPEEDYAKGVSVILSKVPSKKSFFATVKSCNYLQNVLMKMEAVSKGYQYSINVDDKGFVGEGSTENFGLVTKDEILKIPSFENTLAGITASRVIKLAERLVSEKFLKDAKFARIRPEDVYGSSEIFLMGSSIHILPVVSFDEKTIGNGVPGPVHSKLSDLLMKDMTENRELLTEIEWD